MQNENFITKFMRELSQQIDDIHTPYINQFFIQTIKILGVTSFFSFFFYCVSYVGIKLIVYIYGIGA